MPDVPCPPSSDRGSRTEGFCVIGYGKQVGPAFGGPLAAWMHDQTGSWFPVFWLIIFLDALTALLALFVLKPMRRRFIGSRAPS